MSDSQEHVSPADFARLAQRVVRLESLLEQLSNVGHTINEHDDRLDSHERQLQSMQDQLSDIRINTHRMQGDVGRLVDSMTVQAATTERIDKMLTRVLGGVSDLISRCEPIQPKAVL